VAKQRGNIVVVDDDAAFREFLTDALERAGYSTLSVATAEEAQRAIAEQRPAAVLTDIKLPGISGYELCRDVKEAYGDEIAVVLVSGERTEPFDRAAGIFLGADDYLVKPLDTGELTARLWRLVGRADSGQSVARRASSDDKLGALTVREREVLTLLAKGSNQDDIAAALYISPKTVATHIQRILTKLEVHSRTQAVALMLRNEPAVAAPVVAVPDASLRSPRSRSRTRASSRAGVSRDPKRSKTK
jgi:DNA-binding NarL/FixJ family response regulator